MPELAAALLIGLASWRITALIAYERGPFRIFRRFREALGVEHDDVGRGGEPYKWPLGSIAEAVVCPWCLGLYAAAAMWGLWQLSHAAVVVLAASAILVGVEQWNHRK